MKIKKKLSEALFNSIGKRIQSFRRLAETKLNKESEEWEIKKYCAIGAIGCENNYLKLENYSEKVFGHNYKLHGNDEKSIIRNAGISSKTLNQDFRSYISTDAIQDIAKKNPYTLKNKLPLHTLIMTLNDQCKWTFKKIGTEMQLLEDKLAIKYEVKK